MRSPDIGNEDSEATEIINQINDADTITLNNISNNKYVGLPITHTKPDNVFCVHRWWLCSHVWRKDGWYGYIYRRVFS